MSNQKKAQLFRACPKELMVLSGTRIKSMFVHYVYQKNIVRERRLQI